MQAYVFREDAENMQSFAGSSVQIRKTEARKIMWLRLSAHPSPLGFIHAVTVSCLVLSV